ncbi:hypothetical protein LX36DRAFT_115562 [Colletotrichum falcatum]|nr:hypothetical protein LX36DRAFT_115562 [Colletotrichum falcatum]
MAGDILWSWAIPSGFRASYHVTITDCARLFIRAPYRGRDGLSVGDDSLWRNDAVRTRCSIPCILYSPCVNIPSIAISQRLEKKKKEEEEEEKGPRLHGRGERDKRNMNDGRLMMRSFNLRDSLDSHQRGGLLQRTTRRSGTRGGQVECLREL